MENQPRETCADQDATGVSSGLRRLFEASSFGSPQARKAYTNPPRSLVADIVNRVHDELAGDDGSDNGTDTGTDSRLPLPPHLDVRLLIEHNDVVPPPRHVFDRDNNPTLFYPDLVANHWRDAVARRLGQQAFDLAWEYLAAGNLDRTRYWLTVAAEHQWRTRARCSSTSPSS